MCNKEKVVRINESLLLLLGEQAASRLVRVTGVPASTVQAGNHTDFIVEQDGYATM
jgi:hypothetical protein